jgi:type IV fimbrial biogenesis protein FimT
MDRSQGLTLVEMATALALTALVAALAAPSFATGLAGARRSQAVNDFVHAIHLARTAAAETGRPAVLCPGSADCNGSLDWSGRYLVFLDADRDDPPELDDGERILWRGDPTPAIQRWANRAAFVFEPTGRSGTTGTLVVCETTGRVAPRAVIVSRTGRPRTSEEDASGRVLRCP